MRPNSEPGKVTVMLQAGVWGAVAAMAMSGMRTLTNELGLVPAQPMGCWSGLALRRGWRRLSG